MMEKCLLCGLRTSNIPKCLTSETYVCVPCEDKYGSKKLIEKLKELDIKFSTEFIEHKKPFEGKVEYSGGTKEDVIDMIVGIIYQEDIELDEIKERMY